MDDVLLIVGLACLLSLPLMMFHEWAHMQAALCLGVPVKWVRVGGGRPLARFTLRGVPWTIKAKLGDGGGAFIDVKPPFDRLRIGLIALAGPLADIVAGAALRLLGGWLSGQVGGALAALGWAWWVFFLWQMLPRSGSDGNVIFRAVRGTL